jgi:hypothetical protein
MSSDRGQTDEQTGMDERVVKQFDKWIETDKLFNRLNTFILKFDFLPVFLFVRMIGYFLQ